MNDETIAVKLTEHDKHLDILSTAITGLATTATQTNNKLDEVVKVMGQQNVLIEKMSSLGRSLDAVRDLGRATESVVNRYPDVDDMKASLKITETLPTSATLKWGIAILITYLAVSANYLVGHIHMLETKCETHRTVDDMVTLDFSNRIERLEGKHDAK